MVYSIIVRLRILLINYMYVIDIGIIMCYLLFAALFCFSAESQLQKWTRDSTIVQTPLIIEIIVKSTREKQRNFLHFQKILIGPLCTAKIVRGSEHSSQTGVYEFHTRNYNAVYEIAVTCIPGWRYISIINYYYYYYINYN